MNDEALLRYSRHVLLDGFDLDGQQRLVDAQVLLVGAGGLGCPAALYLAASGVGHLLLADGDVVDLTNLQRQIGHTTAEIGQSKVGSLAQRLAALNPLTRLTLLAEHLSGDALFARVAQADLVLDCSDNFATRLAVNRACVALRKPLVSGAAIRTEGQVAVFNLTDASPCYACLYGVDDSEDDRTCSNNGVLSPLAGVIGALQATEAVKILARYGEPLDGRLLLFDARVLEWRTVALGKDPACPVCSAR